MDGSRFDAWTRRKFGLAAGGAVAALVGMTGLTDTEAKKKKKKKCRKLGQTCDINTKNQKCCKKNEDCAQVQGLGSSNFCCKPHNANCSVNTDCCGNRKCSGGICVNP
jgi:hypothetical protein